MSTARRILSNTAIQIFGKLITAVLSIVIIKYITSLETIPGLEGLPSDYKLIYTYLAFFGIIADFGLFTIAVREMSQAKTNEEKAFIMGNIFGMRLFTVITGITLATLFVFIIPLENYTLNVKIGVSIAAITTILTMMASTTSSILQVHLRMKAATIALIIGKIVMTSYIITTVIYFKSIQNAFFHLLFAGIAGTLVTFIITYVYTKRFFPFSLKFHPPYWKRVFKEALPYGAAIILSTIYFRIDVIILSIFREKHEIAIYGYPSSFIELLGIFPIYFMNSTLPTLTRAYQESIEKVKKISSLALSFLSLMAIPLVTGGIILARPLMKFVMNKQFLTGNVIGYYGSDIAFQLLLFPALFAFINTFFTFTLIATGKQSKLFKINFIGVLFNIITNLIFIPKYGFIAAGITTLFSEILVITLTYRETRNDVKIPFPKATILKIIIATAIMSVFIANLSGKINIFPLITFGAGIFILSLIPLRIINDEILDIFKKSDPKANG